MKKNSAIEHAARQASLSSEARGGFREAITRLRQDVARWKRELLAGEVRGTLRHGIAKKAVDTFELRFRRIVKYYRTWAVESKRSIVPSASGKSLESLTLGQLIEHLEQNDRTFTAVAKLDSQGKERFRNRRVMSRLIKQTLDRILELRNLLHHHPDQFAADDDTLQANTVELLTLISDVMTDALFEYAVDRSVSSKKGVSEEGLGTSLKISILPEQES
jgi:hypothetical protein